MTNDAIVTLSSRLSMQEIRRLGANLGVSSYEIDTILRNHPNSIQEANREILSTWLNGQNNRQEAYVNMANALVHKDVRLNLLVREVLNPAASVHQTN